MKPQPLQISTDELRTFLTQEGGFVIDVRPVDAYNGWKLRNEKRGGHVKGAKSLPVKWANYMDWIEIVRTKKIMPEHEIVLYGYSGDEAKKVARVFIRAGYLKLRIYSHFTDEWSANPDLPMDSLPRYRNLVPPEWINSIVSGKTPDEHRGHNTIICHAHYRNREAYLSGHIPGAIDIDTLALESPEASLTVLQHSLLSDRKSQHTNSHLTACSDCGRSVVMGCCHTLFVCPRS